MREFYNNAWFCISIKNNWICFYHQGKHANQFMSKWWYKIVSGCRKYSTTVKFLKSLGKEVVWQPFDVECSQQMSLIKKNWNRALFTHQTLIATMTAKTLEKEIFFLSYTTLGAQLWQGNKMRSCLRLHDFASLQLPRLLGSIMSSSPQKAFKVIFMWCHFLKI